MTKKLYQWDGTPLQDETLAAVRETGERVGILRFGETHCFFRKKWKTYAIAYGAIDHAFERVREVKSSVCCGPMRLSMVSAVLCGGGKELVEIQFEAEEQVERVLALLKEHCPGIRIGLYAS